MPDIDLTDAVDPALVHQNVQFHQTLNTALWVKSNLRLDVRVKLLRVALAFYKFLDVPGLVIKDIVLTGSSASFNYTAHSDLDVHLVTNYDDTEGAENLFTTKKNLWNMSHAISIRGVPVEMYVEDSQKPAYSSGVYSILKGEWVHKPSREAPHWDDAAVLKKVDHLADKIDVLLDGQADPKVLAVVQKKLRSMRQSGLAKGGEFSTENLAFKVLRSLGYLDRLWQAEMRAEDADLSLE